MMIDCDDGVGMWMKCVRLRVGKWQMATDNADKTISNVGGGVCCAMLMKGCRRAICSLIPDTSADDVADIDDEGSKLDASIS